MNENYPTHDTQHTHLRNQVRREDGLPRVVLTLDPNLEPLHYSVLCLDLGEHLRVLPRAEMAWRIFQELAREFRA